MFPFTSKLTLAKQQDEPTLNSDDSLDHGPQLGDEFRHAELVQADSLRLRFRQQSGMHRARQAYADRPCSNRQSRSRSRFANGFEAPLRRALARLGIRRASSIRPLPSESGGTLRASHKGRWLIARASREPMATLLLIGRAFVRRMPQTGAGAA